MSPKTASRITELVIRASPTPGPGACRYAYEAADDNGILVARGVGRTQKEALWDLVNQNYKRVCGMVAQRSNHRCESCGGDCFSSGLEFDHIVPRSKGRRDTIDNLRGLCPSWKIGGCGTHREKHGG